VAAIAVHAVHAAELPAPAPDPLAQSVIDSLAYPPRTTPAALLDAAIRAADVEAFDVASGYFSRLVDQLEKAADNRDDLLANLGDATDAASLRRLERLLADRDESVKPIVRAIREASSLRRREPDRLARDAADLASDSSATRRAAVDRLSRVGVDALPLLVGLLQSVDALEPTRSLARALVQNLGNEARQPLLAWLGSDDVENWPGVIEALAAGISNGDSTDFIHFLLAPALAVDSPPKARDRAVRLLRQVADRGTADSVPPSLGTAVAILTRQLDRVLSIDGLPAADHLLIEPVGNAASAAFGDSSTVERFVWNPTARRLERLNLPLRAARAEVAIHLARDLAALDGTDPHTVRLVMLARLESLLATAGDALTALDRIDPAQVLTALTGKAGFDHEAVADVLDMAVSRGMFAAAAAAARTFSAIPVPAGAESLPLPPSARRSLVRGLAVPDAVLQFEAARALAVAGGDPPYRGSSRVIELLLQAATSTGEDIAVVVHSDHAVRESLATGLSRFGYRTEQVATGRDAILAARANIDTVLVVLSARTIRPTALETVQFIQLQAVGDVPPVLVVVDPFDDDARGCFLTQLIMKFSGLDCVGIIDRLDSLFMPRVDPVAGTVLGPPRFPEQLAQVAGPQAVDPAARQSRAAMRRARAGQALALLAALGDRGWDVSAAESTARMALIRGPLTDSPHDLFTPAVALLATIGTSQAQQAVLREAQADDLPEAAHAAALKGFAASVTHYGILLESPPLLAAYARYNQALDPADRVRAGAILDVLEAPLRKACPVSADAAHPRPTR